MGRIISKISKSKDSSSNVDRRPSSGARTSGKALMAQIVLWGSIIGIFALAGLVIARGWKDEDGESAKYVFGTMLPVVGTWVGTILAYYFSRENFESASENMREMAKQITPAERLMSIPVKSKMIPVNQIVSIKIGADETAADIKLEGKILKTFDDEGKNRLPILDDNGHPLYIIHRSMIDKYITQKITKKESLEESKKSLEELANWTLQDLMNKDPGLKKLFEESFVIVKEDASLGDAKAAMEASSNRLDAFVTCLDAFVTKDGMRNEPVIGWITNVMITENAKA